MRIEEIVASISYEKSPSFPFRYSDSDISALEAAVGCALPADMRWYLLHVGWREILSGQRTLLVPRGDYLLELEFKAAEHHAFTLREYQAFIDGPEGRRLAHDPKRYVPFGQLKGGGSPQVALRLLVSLNDDNRGSIWAVRAIGHFDDQTPPDPIKLSDDLAGFLAQIGPEKKLHPVAEKQNAQLFGRLLREDLAAPAVAPTVAPDADALIRDFFERPRDLVFDGARNVEYQHRVYGQCFESAAEFAAAAKRFAESLDHNPDLCPPPLRRRDIRIAAPQPFREDHAFSQGKHGYALVRVESVVGDGHRLTEQYLLHQDKAGWTLVRRYAASIADVKVKGVGTLGFDAPQKWVLKKKVTPAWSERPVAIRVEGEEDALTPARLAFVQEIMAHADFRREFEGHVFRLYTQKMYPEFLAMPDDEKAEWAKSFPEIRSESEIWPLLGKSGVVAVAGDDRFTVQFDASWDPEHGLSLAVDDWKITR